MATKSNATKPVTGELLPRSSVATQLTKIGLSDVDDVLGSRGISEYLRMQSDGQVQLCLRLIKYATTSKDIAFTGCITNTEDPRYEESEKQREFFESMFSNLSNQKLRDVFISAMDAVAMGFSVQEILFDTVQPGDGITYGGTEATGLWKVKRFKHKRPDSVLFKTDGFMNIVGLAPSFNSTQLLPYEKFWHFILRPRYEDPQGESELRGAWKWWQIKVQACQDFAVYLSKFASPTPRGRHPKFWTKEQQQALLQVLDGFRTQNAIVYPDDADVDLLEANRGGDSTFVSSFEHIDRCISKAILGSFMAVDGNAKERGSQNLGQLHFDVFLLSVMNARDRIAASFKTFVIGPLARWNFAEKALPPSITLGPLEDKQVEALASVFEKLTNAGIVNPEETFIREMMGLPPLEEGKTLEREPQGNDNPENIPEEPVGEQSK